MKWGRGKGMGAGEWVGGWGSFVHHSRSDVGESHHVSRTHTRTHGARAPSISLAVTRSSHAYHLGFFFPSDREGLKKKKKVEMFLSVYFVFSFRVPVRRWGSSRTCRRSCARTSTTRRPCGGTRPKTWRRSNVFRLCHTRRKIKNETSKKHGYHHSTSPASR